MNGAKVMFSRSEIKILLAHYIPTPEGSVVEGSARATELLEERRKLQVRLDEVEGELLRFAVKGGSDG